MNRPLPRLPLPVLIGADLAVRVLFLAWTDPRAISSDLRAWSHVAAEIAAGRNPYSSTAFLSWPPLWMQIIFGLDRLGSAAGIGVIRAVQIFLIVTEALLLVATDTLLHRLNVGGRRWILLLGIALNPVCILLVCQHGNFDVLVALIVVIFLIWVLRHLAESEPSGSAWLVSALLLAVAITLKSVPAVLTPLLCANVRRVPPVIRRVGACLVLGVPLYGLSVLFPLSPRAIMRVLAYRSVSGRFGVTALLHWMDRDEWMPIYSLFFELALASTLILLALRLGRARASSPREILLWSLLLLLAVPFLSGGYGPQYLYWFWPLLLVAGATGSSVFAKTAAAFAAIALVTYVVIYGLLESLGGFLLRAGSSPVLGKAAVLLGSNNVLALVNAPLFLAYALLFAATLRELSYRGLRVVAPDSAEDAAGVASPPGASLEEAPE